MIINKIKNNAKNLIFDLNEIFPLIGRPLIYGWRILHNFKFMIGKRTLEIKWRVKYNLQRKNFRKMYVINPQRIQYCLADKFNKWNEKSQVKEGNWTRGKFLFKELPVYQAFYERVKGRKKWEEIESYQKAIYQIKKHEKRWGCTNKEEFDEKLNKMELLYNRINKNGLKSIIELNEFYNKEKLENQKLWEDIIVVINEDGHFLFVNGVFYLSIAKLLNLPEIPINVIARHKKWIKFKRGLLYYARFGSLYQKLTHPDLQEIPFRYGEDRFNIIKENLSISHGTLLDIGTNLGYFCHKFEDLGFDCYGIESNWYQFHFLKHLKKAENREFKIINDSIFNYNKKKELNFDIVLALYVFHHFLKRKNSYLNLIKLLKRLRVKELFFGAYNPKDFRGKKVYREYGPEEFVNFLIKHSCLNNAKLLAKYENGRALYKLTP